MKKVWVSLCALTAVPALAVSPVTPGPAGEPVWGLWENSTNTVKVQASPCGEKLCGTVVWATEPAVTDARNGGTPRLVGTVVMRDYHWTGKGQWQGHVFVPDLGNTFYSKVRQIDPNRIKISGCVLGGLLCKSQEWHRA